MRNWHSLYEILRFPLGVLFAGICMLGIGNLIVNPAVASFYTVTNVYVLAAGEALTKIGNFLIVNFPLLFLVRIVSRKAGSSVSIVSAIAGYVTFLVVTMYFTDTSLPATAYSSILGINLTSTSVSYLSGSAHYPLQTGLLATAAVALITLSSYSRSRQKSEYDFFAFISKDGYCVLRTIFLSILAGLVTAYIWPYAVDAITVAVDFIAADSTNPINLAVYGVLDRFLSVFNLSALIRTPFWYGSSGGSWINMAGGSIVGDVNIWTQQLAASSLNGMAGRFITPYYVLNMFAVPGMIWAIYSMQTDKLERRRSRLLFIAATIVSLLTGTLLPLEIMLVLLCPILFLFHLAYTGVLYGVFQSMQVYLGYNNSSTNVLTALPGTLMEFITYMGNSSFYKTLGIIVAVGVISFFIYFFFTRFYFNHLALDLFNTGDADRLVKGTIKAVGGIENVKMTHSSITRLTISVYDPNKIDVNRLKQMGSIRVYETKAGYSIGYGASSTMVRKGINKCMRDSVRNVK